MRVEIERVETKGGRARVAFASAIGRATAFWSGAAPSVGASYDVELSAGAPLAWGDDLARSDESAPRIEAAGDGVALHATVEEVADDGVAVLRLDGSILMIETTGAPLPVGTRVRARIASLTLSDTNL